MTLGDRLREYTARRVHVSDIKEPLVKAMWWRRYEKQQEAIVSDCRVAPSEYGSEMELAEVEASHAHTRRAFILSNEWETRKLRA